MATTATTGSATGAPNSTATAGPKVWVRVADARVWADGTLVDGTLAASGSATGDVKGSKKGSAVTMSVQLADGTTVQAKQDDVELQNIRAETDGEDVGVENMSSLAFLNEPAILHNLWRRFMVGAPYTFSGSVCLAVNPYRWLDDLYSAQTVAQYSSAEKAAEAAPHVYRVAADALFDMRDTGSSHSIIVGGESGAGKTETSKIIMSFLTQMAPAKRDDVAAAVLQCNPLMEAFGNATTVRNNNSSRFGKLTQVQFDSTGHIVGCFCETMLLEKSRVVSIAAGERNYHIFYSLLAADVASELGLKQGDTGAYAYLTPANKEFVVAKPKALASIMSVFDLLSVGAPVQRDVLYLLAAVLHLGNISFEADATDSAKSRIAPAAQEALAFAAQMLNVPTEQLNASLISKTLQVAGESMTVPLNAEQAAQARDALAKVLYTSLFSWLVNRINSVLTAGDMTASTIGILDIFGFEAFQHNSFEQLCINYANEKLQQRFTQDEFVVVQAEYEAENVPWESVDFVDNAGVLDLLEGSMGVFALLDEECLRPKGSDATYANKLNTQHAKHASVQRANPKCGYPAFVVAHFAGPVCYDATGMMEKNQDTVPIDLWQIVHTTSRACLLVPEDAPSLAPSTGNSRRRASGLRTTVGRSFRSQLASLMSTVAQTRTHYIRCIKPNDAKSSEQFARDRVVAQLRCAGVVEAIRISRAGYPHRLRHTDLLRRFGCLAPAANVSGDIESAMQTFVSTGLMEPTGYCIGKSRVYLRAGCLERLESARRDVLRSFASKCAAFVAMVYTRKQYLRKRAAAVQVQAMTRMRLAKKQLHQRRTACIKLQAWRRGTMAQRLAHKLRSHRAAVRIQTVVRATRCRKVWVQSRAAAVKIQSLSRRAAARVVFLKKRAEAREQASFAGQLRAVMAQLEAKNAYALELEGRVMMQDAAITCLQEELAAAREAEKQASRRAQQTEQLLAQARAMVQELMGRSPAPNRRRTTPAKLRPEPMEIPAPVLPATSQLKSPKPRLETATNKLSPRQPPMSPLKPRTPLKTVQAGDKENMAAQPRPRKEDIPRSFTAFNIGSDTEEPDLLDSVTYHVSHKVRHVSSLVGTLMHKGARWIQEEADSD